jgi:hypothetical protein
MIKTQEPTTPTQAVVTRAILLYVLVLAGLFVFAYSIVSIRAYVLHLPYPYNTLQYDPSVRFTDWTDCAKRIQHFGESNLLEGYGYPPATVYVFLPFVKLFRNSLHAYLFAAISIFILGALFFSVRVRRITKDKLPQISIWLTLIMGFPASNVLDRGNIEVFLWLFVLLGIVAFVRDWPYTAALLFAIAASMKIYPLLFLLLFIPRRQYKAAVAGGVAVCVLTFFAILGIGPDIQNTVHTMGHNANIVSDVYFVRLNAPSLRFDHSIFGDVKQAMHLYLHSRNLDSAGSPPTFEKATRIYGILAPLFFAVLYLGRLWRMPLLNQFIALTLCSILLPYLSYEYTLVHVYLIWAAFLYFLLTDVKAGRGRLSGLRANVMMLSFALAIAPLSFLLIARSSGVSGQVKSVALIVLLGVVLATPMPSTLFGDLPKALSRNSTIPDEA